jgi:hypothetical protein
MPARRSEAKEGLPVPSQPLVPLLWVANIHKIYNLQISFQQKIKGFRTLAFLICKASGEGG